MGQAGQLSAGSSGRRWDGHSGTGRRWDGHLGTGRRWDGHSGTCIISCELGLLIVYSSATTCALYPSRTLGAYSHFFESAHCCASDLNTIEFCASVQQAQHRSCQRTMSVWWTRWTCAWHGATTCTRFRLSSSLAWTKRLCGTHPWGWQPHTISGTRNRCAALIFWEASPCLLAMKMKWVKLCKLMR